MRLQIAWSLLPRLVRSCAIVDQRRVRGLVSAVGETEMIADPKRKPYQDDDDSERRRQEEALPVKMKAPVALMFGPGDRGWA
jgi:hypothetical protein